MKISITTQTQTQAVNGEMLDAETSAYLTEFKAAVQQVFEGCQAARNYAPLAGIIGEGFSATSQADVVGMANSVKTVAPNPEVLVACQWYGNGVSWGRGDSPALTPEPRHLLFGGKAPVALRGCVGNWCHLDERDLGSGRQVVYNLRRGTQELGLLLTKVGDAWWLVPTAPKAQRGRMASVPRHAVTSMMV